MSEIEERFNRTAEMADEQTKMEWNHETQKARIGDEVVPYENFIWFLNNVPNISLPNKFQVVKDIEDTKSNLKNVMTDDEIEEIREQLTEIERNL